MLVAKKRALVNIVSVICQSTDSVGDLVTIIGSGTVRRVDIHNFEIIHGIIIGKISATVAVMALGGLISNVYAGLTPGVLYFAGLDGRPTPVRPTPGAGSFLFIHTIGSAVDALNLAFSASRFVVKVLG